MELNIIYKCQCGTDILPMFDQAKETNEIYIKGWYCTKCNNLYLLSAGEMRWKKGKEWIDRQETRTY